jgi:hypothetical protein
MHRSGLFFLALTLLFASVAQSSAASTGSQGGPAQLVALIAPWNLHALPLSPNQTPSQTEKDECFKHGGGGHCTDPYPFRSYVVVWDYGNLSAVTGFRFYQVTGGRKLLSDIPTRVPQTITWAAWGARMGTCFVVTAYAGSRESADSNRFCIPYTAIQQNTLQQPH